MQLVKPLILSIIFVWPTTALAYVGPGLGLGTVGVVLAFIFSIVLAIVALFWYPLKRLLGIGKSRDKSQGSVGKPQQDE